MKRLATTFVVLPLAGVLTAGSLAAQQPSRAAAASARSAAIAASFTKNKHVVKERRGTRHEKYKRVTSEPVASTNPESLSGLYAVDDVGSTLQLDVRSDGRVSGSGTEMIGEGIARTFVLTDGKIEGALLTAIKVFRSGDRVKLEGAFLNRRSYDSPADQGFSQFGIGVISAPVMLHGDSHEKFFFRRKSAVSSEVVYH